MIRIPFFLVLAVILTGCANLDAAKNKQIKTNVVVKLSEEEAKTVKLEKSDFKSWIFEQPVKIRVGTDPSSKLLATIDEGATVVAAIVSLGNGWNRIAVKDGPEGFYFGKTLAREKK